MKRLLKVLLIVAIIAAPLNDVGRYLTARYSLDNGTNDAIYDAVDELRSPGAAPNAGGLAAVSAANAAGIELYGYQATTTDVTVWTRVPVEGTWLVGPFKAWRAGKPLKTPFIISMSVRRVL